MIYHGKLFFEVAKNMLFDNIESDYDGYSRIIFAYHDAIQNTGPLTLGFQRWFDAQLCAPLGIVLNQLVQQCQIYLDTTNSNSSILDILRRNGFLQKFNFSEQYDHNQTAIHYKEFSLADGIAFEKYVNKELLLHNSFPKASAPLKEKIRESLAELFSNAVLHSNSCKIATCGQFYPRNHEITFTIADAGVGIHKNVVDCFQRHGYSCPYNAGQAIKWAMMNGHTTKNGFGGIGLAVLKEFVKMNRGFIHLVSHEGYYECSENGELPRQFYKPFPGTFATVKFRTDDTNSYFLSSENPNTLF